MDEAIYWYEKVAHQVHSSAQYNLGLLYEDLQNMERAIHWIKKAVRRGHKEALNYLLDL